MGKKQKRYQPEFKLRVVLETYAKGAVSEVARHYELNANQVSTWRKALLDNGHLVFQTEVSERERKLEKQVEQLENLLAAGRNLSCDITAHAALREIPECWVLGQGAGVAAALAARKNLRVRDVPIKNIQDELRKQGAIVERMATGKVAESGENVTIPA